jgi:hypothetical protein
VRERLIGGAGAVVYVIGMATLSAPAATAGALVAIAALVSPFLQSDSLILGAVFLCAAAVLLPILWLWLPAPEFAWFAHAPQREPAIRYFSAVLVRLAWLAALLLAACLAFIALAWRAPRREPRSRTASTVSVVAAVAVAGWALFRSGTVAGVAAFGHPAGILAGLAVAAACGLAVLNARKAPLVGYGVAGALALGLFAVDTLEGAASVAALPGSRPHGPVAQPMYAVVMSTPQFDLSAALVATLAVAGLALLTTAWRVPESAP